MRRRLSALLIAAAATSATAEGAEQVAFELFFGGLRAGEMAVELFRGEGRYALRAEGRPASWVRTLYRAGISAEGSGAVASAPRPERFAVRARFGDDDQRVEVLWGPDGAPAQVTADPVWRARPWEVDPTAQRGALDPVAVAVRLLEPRTPEALCAERIEVFDGRRVSRLTLGAPEAREGGWVCTGDWRRAAGFRPRDLAKRPVPVRADFRPGPDGRAELARLEVDTGYGIAVARRR